ncbi:hypothetical protein QOZ80_7BG0598840 [Eleusine coracana subsp. coracana]|nr:hypothetical protein QOZ80_7BG0598840 [Eleusine coracana subsp. coracana]
MTRTGSATSPTGCSSTCLAVWAVFVKPCAPACSRSHRWRGLWTELRDLRLDGVAPEALEIVLGRVRPNINYLKMRVPRDPSITGARISSLLRAIDQLAPKELMVSVYGCNNFFFDDPIPFALPCYSRATSMHLNVVWLELNLPPASLEQLWLNLVACTVDLSAILRRCPRLRKVGMTSAMGRTMDTVVLDSMSLEEVDFFTIDADAPSNIVMIAPELKKFFLDWNVDSEFTFSISAPKMEEFSLRSKHAHKTVTVLKVATGEMNHSHCLISKR